MWEDANGDQKVDLGEYMESCWWEGCAYNFNATDSDKNGVLDEADAVYWA